MKIQHKYFFLLIVYLSFNSVTFSKDTVNMIVTYHHVIENGKETKSKVAINQKIYKLDGKLIRDIYFDANTRKIIKYIFFMYNDKHLIGERIFNHADSLVFKNEFIYNQSGQKIIERKYQSGRLYSETEHQYKNKDLVSSICKDENGKLLYLAKYYYDDLGNEIKFKCKSKTKDVPYDYKSSSTEILYSTDNELIEEKIISAVTIDGKKEKYTIKYSYNDKGEIKSEKYFLANQPDKPYKVLKYSKNDLDAIYQYDRDGNLIDMNTINYSRHKINLNED